MKNILLIITLILTPFNLFCQTVTIHSITHSRQTNGGQYTLDGGEMSTGARQKLLSPANFGPTGTYTKSVTILDAYGTSGSVSAVSSLPYSDLFIFGAFDKLDATLIPFTYSEIDSLYQWSKRGGKLIICGSSGDGGYNPAILNSKWGFQVQGSVPSSFIPSSTGLTTDIFNGPFGSIDSAKQGGTMQGYFNTFPANVSILATDRNNHPTIIMDCNTLDLIVSDIDGFTSLDGSVSTGSFISNDQDKYVLNSIAFMDLLQPLPQITNTSGVLSLNSSYNNYQWYRNDSSITGAINPTVITTDSGEYHVEVTLNGGCKVKSNSIEITSPNGISEAENTSSFQLFPNPTTGEFTLDLAQDASDIVITNLLGQAVIKTRTTKKTINFKLAPDNIYLVSVHDKKGVSTRRVIVNH